MWRVLIQAAVFTALLGLVALLVVPVGGGLAAFAVTTLWVHGPVSPFLPAAYEPVLMHYGTLFPPLQIALLGATANLAVEAANYRIYGQALSQTALSRFRESRIARLALGLFRRSPFLTVWIGAWSPIPDWTIRILAPMSGYPLLRYLAAMGLGRIPRYWLFAELGRRSGVPTWWLPVAFGLSLTAGGVALWRARRSGRPAAPVMSYPVGSAPPARAG
jgi:membrane protein YqaA with SNARE-associated domain